MTGTRLALLARTLIAATAAMLAAPAALAQTGGGGGGAPVTFFMIINGRVNGTAAISPRAGDRVAAIVEGGDTVEDVLDGAGAWESLTIARTTNDTATIRFEFRRGSGRYMLVPSAGATDQATIQFLGNSNPLSAAFNAQTLTLHIGPVISGGGGDGDGTGGDGSGAGGSPDVNGDGVVTIDDARLVMRWVIGFRRDLEGSTLDVNADSRINTQDVTEILRRMGETVEAAAPETDATTP